MTEEEYRDLPELSYAGISTFMKSDEGEIGDLDSDVDIAVAGIPFDGGQGKRAGARFGPEAIRRATGPYAYYGEYKGDLLNVESEKHIDYNEMSIRDYGDIATVPNSITETRDQVIAAVEQLADSAFPVLLGGDHYLTYPSFLGVANALSEDVGVVQLDAHTDTVGESRLYGKHFNGSPMARIAESKYGSYGTHAMVGIRGYEDSNFYSLAESEGIYVDYMKNVRERGFATCVQEAIEHVVDQVDHVYLTVDIDVVDPAFASGTGSPEPGGITSSELVNAMTVIGTYEEIAAVDMMEVAPDFDPTTSTAQLAAKSIVRFLEQRSL
jgi:agmatinase